MPEANEPQSVRIFKASVSQAVTEAGLDQTENLPELHHYTTADGLTGLLANRSIWATHYAYLNDNSEITYAKELLNEVINEKIANANPTSAAILRAIRNTPNGLLTPAECFVACFCEQGDLLSQWRGYGSNGGYALGLIPTGNKNHVAGKPYTLGKVLYDRTRQHSLLSLFVDYFSTAIETCSPACSPADVEESLFVDLTIDDLQPMSVLNAPISLRETCWAAVYKYAQIAPYLKNPAFKSEQEWRIVHTRSISPSPRDVDLRFRSNRGMVIPYIEIELFLAESPIQPPIDNEINFFTNSITVGPNVNFQRARRSIELLRSRHMPAIPINIFPSSTPVIL